MLAWRDRTNSSQSRLGAVLTDTVIADTAAPSELVIGRTLPRASPPPGWSPSPTVAWIEARRALARTETRRSVGASALRTDRDSYSDAASRAASFSHGAAADRSPTDAGRK